MLPDALTPVERHGDVWFKRDDLFSIAGVSGGKVRACAALAQGADGLVTAGSRGSPQVNIVAHIAQALGVPCRGHVPSGELHAEVVAARAAGAGIVQHRPGYNTVLIARAKADADVFGWRYVPFGMECREAVTLTAGQVANLPRSSRRLVVAVGSGMSLAGILHGFDAAGWHLPVLGVVVGADPTKRLDRYAPRWWRDPAAVQLVRPDTGYAKPAANRRFAAGGPLLDPVYEAKCLPYLAAGDVFWLVGMSQTAADGQMAEAA